MTGAQRSIHDLRASGDRLAAIERTGEEDVGGGAEGVALFMNRMRAEFQNAMLMTGAGAVYQLGHLRFTTASQESYIASVSNRVATLMRVGLGDHIHCAVFRKSKKTPPVARTVKAR